ncbi:MAG: ABC transporter ATP-binding protein [Bacteroidetes bacterium]|nr:ABC transporter ATP-binding protein [Bacteroidota bacterium]
MTQPAVSLQNCSFSYGNQPVWTDLSVDISANQFSVILGRNGSGKSTLLRVMAGLLKPSSGTALVHGKNPDDISGSERAGLIGFLPQFHRAVFPFSVRDVVVTGRAGRSGFLPTEKDHEITEAALHQTGIFHLADKPYTQLSGGEQQLVMATRILAQQPAVIFLDEPTSHLDLYYQSALLSTLKSLSKDQFTLIAVLHDPNLAFRFGDEFFFLKKGKLVKPESGQEPWDADFLSGIFETPLETIPFEGKAFVVHR